MSTTLLRRTRHLHPALTRSVAPPFGPITLDALKTSLQIQHSNDDTDLAQLIKDATRLIEKRISLGMVEQTWVQTQDAAPSIYSLLRRPILSIVKVEYVPDDDVETWTELDSSYYYLAGERIVARSSYPSIRSAAGWRTTFKVGYMALPDPYDADDEDDAREAIPEDLRRAVIQYVGHLYENKEGQGSEAKYEVAAKAYGALPPNIILLLEPFLDWKVQ